MQVLYAFWPFALACLATTNTTKRTLAPTFTYCCHYVRQSPLPSYPTAQYLRVLYATMLTIPHLSYHLYIFDRLPPL